MPPCVAVLSARNHERGHSRAAEGFEQGLKGLVYAVFLLVKPSCDLVPGRFA